MSTGKLGRPELQGGLERHDLICKCVRRKTIGQGFVFLLKLPHATKVGFSEQAVQELQLEATRKQGAMSEVVLMIAAIEMVLHTIEP